jgi:FMN-dependent NADH-azoreductase
MKLLHIDSSITGANSVSRQVSAEVVKLLRGTVPTLQVARRDLDAHPLPHLDSVVLSAAIANAPADEHTRNAIAQNGEALEEFLGADVIVIGTPMYNFAVPSQLKAWIDRILIAGKTFRYTEKGPEGLAGGKKVIVASSRGGIYAPGGPMAALDFQEPYLRTVFRFIGIYDVTFVRAEGIALGPEHREKALRNAIESVSAAVVPLALSKAA